MQSQRITGRRTDNIAYLEHYAAQPACSQIVLASLKDLQFPGKAQVHSSSQDSKLISRTAELSLIGGTTDPALNIHELPHIFRSEPLPPAPISFSSIVMSQPQLAAKKEASSNSVPPSVSVSTVSGSEPDLEVQVYDWEESQKDPSVGSDDWTEAKKKGGKKEKDKSGSVERKERGGRRGLAGTAAAAANFNGSGRERKTKRGSKGKKDFGVRDMKPRPCHSYYLSKFFLCLCCTRYNLIGEKARALLIYRSSGM
jgi:hypothetical protein